MRLLWHMSGLWVNAPGFMLDELEKKFLTAITKKYTKAKLPIIWKKLRICIFKSLFELAIFFCEFYKTT